jgi:hypothetical protein
MARSASVSLTSEVRGLFSQIFDLLNVAMKFTLLDNGISGGYEFGSRRNHIA